MVKRHLVQVVLPLVTGRGQKLERPWFDAFMHELTDRFGGATSFARSPGEGLWDSGNRSAKDQVAVVEVMTETMEEAYWQELKARLEKDLSQDEIVVRSWPMTSL
jgi:hypothetical protein